MITHVTGGLSDAGTMATFHINTGGQWNLDTPEQELELSDRGSLTLLDLDGDQRIDLLIFDPYRAGEPLKLLRNRGTLPGSPPVLEAPQLPDSQDRSRRLRALGHLD